MSCCETQNLAVGYGAPLLRDIALHAERGKILALIGPNGAGKSTLLKTLAGQLAAQGGAVLLDGQDLTAYSPIARARKLALMLPHTARTELTSCFEVAAAGRYPYTGRLGILSDADRQQVHDALCLVRAEELEDRDFARISDGQRQRVLLARAVCQQPEILLLDEPTSFLDVKGKAELMDILQVLAHEKNVAVIVTLHELELAQRLADAVVCVAPSGVSAVLAPQDAFAQDNICALFGLTTDQYAVLFAGSGAKPKPQFEHYIRSGQRLLRCGYTTGTCAALGAAGAARLLLTGHAPESVGLRTPKGIVVEVAPQFCRLTADGAACAIVKDGGDDIDATTGLPVIAAVTLLPGAPRTVTIDGGAGVGRVTKPGLDQPVGAAAINRVPRQMITEALLREADAVGYGAERLRPRTESAVVQQVDYGRFHAALPVGKTSGCSDGASLHGKLQQALTVGAALCQRAALHGSLVAGGLHVMLKGAQGQPRQRIEPVQADDGIKQRLHQRVAAAEGGPRMQQHSLPRRALQAVRQVDARAHKAQCERRGHARPAVAAVGRFAGQRHTAL